MFGQSPSGTPSKLTYAFVGEQEERLVSTSTNYVNIEYSKIYQEMLNESVL